MLQPPIWLCACYHRRQLPPPSSCPTSPPVPLNTVKGAFLEHPVAQVTSSNVTLEAFLLKLNPCLVFMTLDSGILPSPSSFTLFQLSYIHKPAHCQEHTFPSHLSPPLFPHGTSVHLSHPSLHSSMYIKGLIFFGSLGPSPKVEATSYSAFQLLSYLASSRMLYLLLPSPCIWVLNPVSDPHSNFLFTCQYAPKGKVCFLLILYS